MVTYSSYFIRSAIRLSYSVGIDNAALALNISKNLISQWRKEYSGFIDEDNRLYSCCYGDINKCAAILQLEKKIEELSRSNKILSRLAVSLIRDR